MNKEQFTKWLESNNACSDAVIWIGKRSLKQAWDECERADWMLWYMCRAELATKRERIHIVCDCAATALKYVPKGEDRPREAIEAARRYADEPTEENLRLLNAAGAAAGAAVWVAWATRAAAGAAVWAAAGAAVWAAEFAWGAAAEAAGGAAGAAAGIAAWVVAHKQMCEMIREKIKL